MQRKSFVTRMPDKAGAFLLASKIVAQNGGNIVRASYNKAVDLNMLFLDVEAPAGKLRDIEEELLRIGYLNEKITEIRVIEISVRIPDRPGAILPVLDILQKHSINISYLNSSSGSEPYQDFKFGLLIENPDIIKTLLDEISEVYRIDIIGCDSKEENLDNTVFYIRLADEMQKLLDLDSETTMQFIAESNRILQALQSGGEDASKVFDYIRRFAYFVSKYRGDRFHADIETFHVTEQVTLYAIKPPCGSNTYLFDAGDAIVLIDTGYAIYAEEMQKVFRFLIPDYEAREKTIYITHADVDHCGLLSKIEDAEIRLNRISADSLIRQIKGLTDFRENTELGFGYSKISRIISGYRPPDPARFHVINSDTPATHEDLLPIGSMSVGDLFFEILEGSGGHLDGEMIFLSRKHSIILTGDLLVNISGFSKETAEFNSLAPFLLRSVNIDSSKASDMRKKLIALIEKQSRLSSKPVMICCGHGPVSMLKDRKLLPYGLA